MIPDFNKYGYLNRGIYQASLDEIEKRFGCDSLNRCELFKKLQSVIKLLLKHKGDIIKFLINGSFVTDKEEPGDIDCILLIKDSFDFNSKEATQLKDAKKLFNIHLFIHTESDYAYHQRRISFFGHDRNKIPKGLVEVIL